MGNYQLRDRTKTKKRTAFTESHSNVENSNKSKSHGNSNGETSNHSKSHANSNHSKAHGNSNGENSNNAKSNSNGKNSSNYKPKPKSKQIPQSTGVTHALRSDPMTSYYYACSCCSRVLPSKERRTLHELQCHGVEDEGPAPIIVRIRKPIQPITESEQRIQPIRESVQSVQPIRESVQTVQPVTESVQTVQPIQSSVEAIPQISAPAPKRIRQIQKPKAKSKKVANHRDSGSGIYACKHCQSTFTSPWNLKVHLQTIHENIRPFTCSSCGKGFKQRIHLHGHIVSTHSKVRAFRCEFCSIGFSKKWNLFDHVRKAHQGTEADLKRLKLLYSKRRKSVENIDD